VRSAPFGAVLGASLLWLVIGGFALWELWPIVPHEVLGTLAFVAAVPPLWLIAYQVDEEEWSRIWQFISQHPNRWLRIGLGVLFGLIFLAASLVTFL
jgi:hypothetical protein